MKYAITGHTQGLGMAFANLSSVQKNFIGFSRSNGFDIASQESRRSIIESAKSCDVFINNAHSGYAQTTLLYELYTSWKDQNKIIINIGSNTTTGVKNHIWPYSAQKAALDKASEQLSNLDNLCKVVLFRFGWIGTDRVIDQYHPKNYLKPDDSANFIYSQLVWIEKYHLSDITIRY
jgi:hypothetical protein